ncbi:MAG TPA: ferritin-like protein [Thermoanaerobaculia bacterium]|jgi:rubrerythrin
MLYIQRQKLDTIEDLRTALANAIRLEFATIPPYLTALYSIKDGTNAAIAANLRTIVIQEMLHLSLAANILNAVGGRPDFPGSVPKYPGPLPMGIGNEPGKPFTVSLGKLSLERVRNVFMVIEEPEHPLVFPERNLLAAAPPEFHTIGEFYEAVSALIETLGEEIFTGDPNRQVTGWFGPDELFAIDGVAGARKAIEIIVTQGEGTSTSPAEGPAGLAHYYRFEEISRGQTLTQGEDGQYSWGDPPIVLDEDGIWNVCYGRLPVVTDDTPVSRASRQCDQTFSALVDALQQTFDGDPGHLDASIGLMYSLRLQAQQLMAMPIPGVTIHAGPLFLYGATTAAG